MPLLPRMCTMPLASLSTRLALSSTAGHLPQLSNAPAELLPQICHHQARADCHHELLRLLSSEAKTTPYMGRTAGIRPLPNTSPFADATTINPPSPATAACHSWLSIPWNTMQCKT